MPKTDVVIRIDLEGPGGNAFAIMGKVIRELKRNGHGDLVKEYQERAMSGDYNNLLLVTQEFVEVE